MQLFDTHVTLDASTVRKTSDGYLTAFARVGRTGIQLYQGREIGQVGDDATKIFRVYRAPEEVFAKDAMASAAHKPMTSDHPKKAVDAASWKKDAIGQMGDTVTRDGDFVRVPLVMMDAQAVSDWEAGKRELSLGYTCEIVMQDGVTDGGEAYDAVQRDIRINHLALVHKARGGDKLRVGDDTPDTGEPKVPKLMMIDGFSVNLEDAASVETAISKVLADRKTAQDAVAALNTTIGEHVATIAARDGEIVVLKADAESAKITPDKLDQLVQARDGVVTVAKAVIGATFDAKGKTDGEIKRLVVAKRIGDAAAAGITEDAGINGAYAAIAATVDTKKKTPVGDDLRDSLNEGGGVDVSDAQALLDKAREERRKEHRTAHQGVTEH